MKTAEAKSSHSHQHGNAETSFFNQEHGSSFFSEQSSEYRPFFSSANTLSFIQPKCASEHKPFFQPAAVPFIQAKYPTCEGEAEEQQEQSAETLTVGRMPAFESEEAGVQRMPAFESEADDQVQTQSLLQRQAETEMEPEEETSTDTDLQTKLASNAIDPPEDKGDNSENTLLFTQTKLTIGKPNDRYEQEADVVADQVVAMPKQRGDLAPGIQTKPLRKTIAKLSRRQGAAVRPKRLQRLPKVQKQGNGSLMASNDMASRLHSSRGGGSSLDEATRSEMESSFGADFGDVRVHTGSEAAQLSQDLGAKAFTHGSDIYFNQGQYNPNSSEGKHLLAHELTHTVQQGATVQRKPKVVSKYHTPDVQAGFFDDPLGSIKSAAGSVLKKAGISIDALRERLADFVDDNIPIYSLLSVAIEYDVLRGKRVERTRKNIIKGVFSLINPLGSILRKRLEERGIIDQAFEWIKSELNRLRLTKGDIKAKFKQFLDGVTLVTTSPIDDNIDLFKRTFGSIFSSIATFIQNVGNKVYEMIKQAFLRLLGELAKKIGGYDLLADLLGTDPITGEARNASTADILRGILKLPVIQAVGGDKLLKKLEELKLIEKTANWIDEQWALLKAGFSSLLSIAEKFLSLFTLSVEVLTDPMKIVNEIKTEVLSFVNSAISFFKNLASKALEIIKEAMIWLVNKFVDQNSPAWELAVFVLGENPLTGEKVPRNYLKLIGAFLKLLPGGETLYQKFIETGALQRMVGWIQNAIQEFIAILLGLKDAFVSMWKSVTIDALLNPIGFFTEVVNLFKKPVLRLVAFVKDVLIKIFEVLMELMKLPKKIVKEIIENAIKAFNDIRKDPIKFLLNLLKAVKEGFAQFFDNIGKHLLSGVTGWLFGQLAKAGITIPKKLDLASILGLVLQVLNLTIDNLWARLAKKIGQDKVDKIKGAIDKLVGIWTFVKDVVKNGISAIWKYIQSQISGLWNMILDKAKDWIITTIIQKVTVKLLTMLDPTGIMAVINGFIAFYKAIESFIEKLKEMLEIAASFVKGVAEIARGTVAKGADFLENALAAALPVALSFLANQIGLGGIGDKIKEIVQTVRGFINKGIDWLLDKAIKLLRKGKATAGKLVAWWKKRRTFKTSAGKSHSLSFKGKGKKAKLEARSPRLITIVPVSSLRSLLSQKDVKNKIEADSKNNLLLEAEKLEGLLDDPETESKSSQIDTSLTRIVSILKTSKILDREALPPTKVVWSTNQDRAVKVTADPLTDQPGNTKGAPADNSVLGNDWTYVATRLFSSYYSKTAKRNVGRPLVDATHLLNADFHGPSTKWNLAIAPSTINSQMKAGENKARPILGKRKLRYTAQAAYFSNSQPTDSTKPDFVEQKLKFLVAKSITLTIEKWNEAKKGYESVFGPKSYKMNSLPKAQAELKTPTEAQILTILRNNKITDIIVKDGKQYAKTITKSIVVSKLKDVIQNEADDYVTINAPNITPVYNKLIAGGQVYISPPPMNETHILVG